MLHRLYHFLKYSRFYENNGHDANALQNENYFYYTYHIYIKEKAEYKLSFISMLFPRLYFLYIWKAKNIGK